MINDSNVEAKIHRFRPMKPLRRLKRGEVLELARHFEKRARNAAAAAALAERQRLKRATDTRLWTEPKSVSETLELVLAIYHGGRFTWEEYFFHSAIAVETYYDHLTFHGPSPWKEKLRPISAKMKAVERKFGLKPDEYWPIGQAPAEYKRLNEQWMRVHDRGFAALLQEFKLTKHSRLWRHNRDEFDRLREAGRASVHEASDTENATAKLVEMYIKEAETCAKAKAFYAACTMLGSASEAVILLKCLQAPAEVAIAKARISGSARFHKGGPQYWNLGQLVEIAKEAGWIANLETTHVMVHIVNLLNHLQDIRNLVHPGRHAIRRPHVSIGHEQYADAKAAYLALRFALEQAGQQAGITLSR